MEIHYGFVDDAPNWRSRSGSGPSSSPQAPEPFDAVMTGPTPSGDSILRSTPNHLGSWEPQLSRAFRTLNMVIPEPVFLKAHGVRLTDNLFGNQTVSSMKAGTQC